MNLTQSHSTVLCLKEGSSWVTGERDYMQSTDMKYQFNKIFRLLIKKGNAGKPHFGPNLDPLDPNLAHKNFLRRFSSTR